MPNLRPNLVSLREKKGLIPALGAALLLVGLSIATVGAAPPEQSPPEKLSTQRGEVARRTNPRHPHRAADQMIDWMATAAHHDT